MAPGFSRYPKCAKKTWRTDKMADKGKGARPITEDRFGKCSQRPCHLPNVSAIPPLGVSSCTATGPLSSPNPAYTLTLLLRHSRAPQRTPSRFASRRSTNSLDAPRQPVLVFSLWVRNFEVLSSSFHVLTLDPNSAKDFPCLNQVMILSERPRSDEPLDPYVATQFLRALCVTCGVDAVEYPTVTGSYPTDSKAINVAVFSEAAIQQVLLGKKDAPYRIRAEPRELSLR